MHKYVIILPKIGKFGNASGNSWKERKNYNEGVHDNVGKVKVKSWKNIENIEGFVNI